MGSFDDLVWAESGKRVRSGAGFFVLQGFCCGEVKTCYKVIQVLGLLVLVRWRLGLDHVANFHVEDVQDVDGRYWR